MAVIQSEPDSGPAEGAPNRVAYMADAGIEAGHPPPRLGSGHNDPIRSTSIAILTSGSAHPARPAALFASDNDLECDVFRRGHLAKPSNNLGPVICGEPAENLMLDSIALFD